MKIALCGSGKGDYKGLLEKVRVIGEEIAKNNAILYTGGCYGYPYEAAKAAFQNKGITVAISPAKSIEDHKTRYNFPSDVFSDYIFTGLGIPERNYVLIKAVDAVIIFNGQIGTLNEFTVAFHEQKTIGILEGLGGISELIPKIAEICDKRGEKGNIVYEKDPKELVKKCMNRGKTRSS